METVTLDGYNDFKLDYETTKTICRGCLTTEKPMFNILGISQQFFYLSGLNVTDCDGLPPWLCMECSALLHKSVRFKQKLLRAHEILYEYVTRCAPFPIDAQDPELSKYSSPDLCETKTLVIDNAGRGRNGFHRALEHKKNIQLEKKPKIHLPLLPEIMVPITENYLTEVPIQLIPTDLVPTEANTDERTVSPKIDGDINKIEGDMNNFDGDINKIEGEVNNIDGDELKEELTCTDYEDNLPLDEYKDSIEKMSEEEFASLLLMENGKLELKEVDLKRRKRKKDEKVKKKSEPKRSSIRKTVEIDPNKIRIITLDPKEQLKQREQESNSNGYKKLPFKCKLCFKGFNFEEKLDNHMMKHSPSRGKYECKLCRMFLPTPYSYSIHMLIHTQRYECIECGCRMIDRSSIVQHYKTKHEGVVTQFTCQICGKVSSNNKTHRGHMRNHHGGERPECKICEKTFVNKDSLMEHILIHKGVKNYSCDTCEAKFRTLNQVKHHQLKHSDVKEFYCVECDVRFKSAHNLQKHLRDSLKHKDPSTFEYKCESCDKKFETVTSRARHVAVQHLGERRHVCGTCGARLASRGSLLKHVRLHGGAPPRTHACPLCHKTFRGAHVLTNHTRTHTGERPFSCRVCTLAFGQRAALAAHVRTAHLTD